MNDSFAKLRCYDYVSDDNVKTRLHAPHPVLGSHPGRSDEQIAKELAITNSKPLLNPKTGGRR